MSKMNLNLSLIVETEKETKDLLMNMLMKYDNISIKKVRKQENIINTETKEVKKGSYRIDFIVEYNDEKDNDIAFDGKPRRPLKTIQNDEALNENRISFEF